MKNILEELNQEVGIKGSMVITPDGIMVAAALGPELQEELVAAIVSSLLVAVRKASSGLEAEGGLKSCLLHASKGKIMFYDMGNAFNTEALYCEELDPTNLPKSDPCARWSFGDLRYSGGFGFRCTSPIGPLRLDAARSRVSRGDQHGHFRRRQQDRTGVRRRPSRPDRFRRCVLDA